MQPEDVIIVHSNQASIPNKELLRKIRGSFWKSFDHRLIIILFLSFLIHSGFLYYLISIKVTPHEIAIIEKIPKRFAKLIVEKPIKKKEIIPNTNINEKTKQSTLEETDKTVPKTPAEKHKMERKVAKKAVAVRAAQVENKIRTVGVLGMLTGLGSTAKGPSVIDILGKTNRKQRFKDLDEALKNMSGLKKTNNINILNRKLVRSKDISVNYKEDIDDLVTSVGVEKATSFAKRGDFVIHRPESVEGAASSNTKRNNQAINKVVSSNKASIRRSYEKYLNRNPDLAGKITIQFTIASSGKVIAIKLIENTTKNIELGKEIARKIKMWRFEAISAGDVSITYPFIFRPS